MAPGSPVKHSLAFDAYAPTPDRLVGIVFFTHALDAAPATRHQASRKKHGPSCPAIQVAVKDRPRGSANVHLDRQFVILYGDCTSDTLNPDAPFWSPVRRVE